MYPDQHFRMMDLYRKFLNILPDLKLSHEMTELFETVECEKVAASRDHSRIKIYIHSDRLIAHKAIRETERAIRSQMFKDQVYAWLKNTTCPGSIRRRDCWRHILEV